MACRKAVWRRRRRARASTPARSAAGSSDCRRARSRRSARRRTPLRRSESGGANGLFLKDLQVGLSSGRPSAGCLGPGHGGNKNYSARAVENRRFFRKFLPARDCRAAPRPTVLRAAQTDPSKMRSRRQPGSRRDAAVQRCRDGLAGGAPTPHINATGPTQVLRWIPV